EACQGNALADAQAERRVARLLGRDAAGFERELRLEPLALQRVDPEIERRRTRKRGKLAAELTAEDGAEMRVEPLRIVPADMVRHVAVQTLDLGERLEEALLGGDQRCRTEAVAVAGAGDLLRAPALDENQRRQQAPPRIAAERAAPQA